MPALTVIPAVPRTSPKEAKPVAGSDSGHSEQHSQPAETKESGATAADADRATPPDQAVTEAKLAAPAHGPPKLWTGLFAKSSASATTGSTSSSPRGTNGSAVADGSGTVNGTSGMSGCARSNANSLAEALRAYRVGSAEKIPFVEPRGLINTGNMCYMNSVSLLARVLVLGLG